MARILAKITPGFAWRWGLKNPYGWEQLSFWMRLWPELRRGQFDVLHVQDPMVAYWCRLFRKWGWVKTKEILAHGTEETAGFLSSFDYVQQLAPWHLEQTAGFRVQGSGGRGGERIQKSEVRIQKGEWAVGGREERLNHEGHEDHEAGRGEYWVALPNFVDCGVFFPDAGRRQAMRVDLGIPEDAFVVGCVAAVKKHHKRIDYLIREFARYSHGQQDAVAAHSAPPTIKSREPFLLIAGAKTGETDELNELAEVLIPGRYKILTDCGRERMPDVYRVMDVFVLTSLFEMMPIALLEALASGLPCVVNQHPVLAWMVGVRKTTDHGLQTTDGGGAIDMSCEGVLADLLGGMTLEWIKTRGHQARERAVAMFSKEAVVAQYIGYYEEVAGSSPHARRH